MIRRRVSFSRFDAASQPFVAASLALGAETKYRQRSYLR